MGKLVKQRTNQISSKLRFDPHHIEAKGLALKKVVGLSPRGIAFISFCAFALAGLGFYRYVSFTQARMERLESQNQELKHGFGNLQKTLDQIVIQNLSTNEQAKQARPLQVINNIQIPESPKARQAQEKRFYETGSYLMPRIALRQKELSHYVDELTPALARDYADLLLQISIQKNKFNRHQSSDLESFRSFNRLNGHDRQAYDAFRENQMAQSNELNRIFKKISDSYRERNLASSLGKNPTF